MEIENIKSTWKNSEGIEKSKTELLMMTKIKSHTKVKEIKIKFLVEATLLSVFLAVYYTGFDGATKPLWANALLIISTIGYIIARFVGWYVLQNPVNDGNLKKSLNRFQTKLKQVALSILLTAFLFGSAFISFFASSIDFTREKYFLLVGMILALLFLIYLSNRNWIRRINVITTTIKEFEDSTI